MTGEGANQFLFLERVLPDFFVGAATEYGFARNAQLEDVVVEPANLTGILALLRVPETDFFVAARRADLIVGEGHGKHGALMAGVTGLQFAALRVINTGRAIPACRREARAVAAPGNGHDPVGVLLDDQLFPGSGDVVDVNGIVRSPDRQS